MKPQTIGVCLACGAVLMAGAQDNPAQRERVLSRPDCAGAGNILAEDAAEPLNVTFVRVQHIGDPGTGELRAEAAGEVTWDVGTMTGLHSPASAQRGFRDAPPPVASSAFQLSCGDAGFLINSFQFSHSSPLVGEGPSASIARTLDPSLPAFDETHAAFVLQALMALPTVVSPNLVADRGVTQLSFFYYVRDTRSGTVLAHVIGVHDNRPAALGGEPGDALGNDGFTAFVGSSLGYSRYVDAGPGSHLMTFATAWDEPRFFRAEIAYPRFKAMLEALQAQAPSISTEPADYRIWLFGVLAEVAVGTDHDHDVIFAGHVRDLALLRARVERRAGLFRRWRRCGSR